MYSTLAVLQCVNQDIRLISRRSARLAFPICIYTYIWGGPDDLRMSRPSLHAQHTRVAERRERREWERDGKGERCRETSTWMCWFRASFRTHVHTYMHTRRKGKNRAGNNLKEFILTISCLHHVRNTDTHGYTHRHRHRQTDRQTPTPTPINIQRLALWDAYIYIHICKYVYIYKLVYTYIHSMYTHIHTVKYIHIYKCIYIQKHIHTHTHTHT